MSDDMWRERRDRDDFSEYGSLFDDAEPTQNIDEVRSKKAKESEAITFGASDTGNLPHWTDPPTGEVPRIDVERRRRRGRRARRVVVVLVRVAGVAGRRADRGPAPPAGAAPGNNAA